jgi:hypothetical protein
MSAPRASCSAPHLNRAPVKPYANQRKVTLIPGCPEKRRAKHCCPGIIRVIDRNTLQFLFTFPGQPSRLMVLLRSVHQPYGLMGNVIDLGREIFGVQYPFFIKIIHGFFQDIAVGWSETLIKTPKIVFVGKPKGNKTLTRAAAN